MIAATKICTKIPPRSKETLGTGALEGLSREVFQNS